MFFNPKLYHQYWHLLQDVLVINPHAPQQTTPEARSLIKYYWKEISARNELYCGSVRDAKTVPPPGSDETSSAFNQFVALGDASNSEVDEEERLISFLDDVGLTIDSGVGLQIDGSKNNEWKDVRGWHAASVCNKIFGSCDNVEDTTTTCSKIETLCTWATTTERSGDWRAYFIASVLSNYIQGLFPDAEVPKMEGEDHSHNKAIDEQQRRMTVQESLMRFLDHSDAHDIARLSEDGSHMDLDHGKFTGYAVYELDRTVLTDETCCSPAESIPSQSSIGYFFDILIQQSIFSYHKYLLRLIARGDLEPEKRNCEKSRQSLYYLRYLSSTDNMPVYLQNQRRVAIYGADNKKGDVEEQKMHGELRRVVEAALLGKGDPHKGTFGLDVDMMTQPDFDDPIGDFYLYLTDHLEEAVQRIVRKTSRYCVVKFARDWLVPEVKKFVVRNVQ